MFPGIRGIPGWAAVLLIVAFVALSYTIDWNKPILGRPLTILYFAGCVLAVLLVRRRGLFWPAVVPPIVGAIGVPLFYLLTATPIGDSLSRADVLTALVPLAKRFPLILVTWLIVLAIAVVRGFVLEPSTTRDNHHLAEKVRGRLGLTGKQSSSRRPAPKQSAAAASRAARHRDKDRGDKDRRDGDRPLPPIRSTSTKSESKQPETTAEKLAAKTKATRAAAGTAARRDRAAGGEAEPRSAGPRAGSRRLAGKEPHSERGWRTRRED